MTDPVTVYSRGSEFCIKYLRCRPQVADSLYERIFVYHAEHGGRFDTAHDVGAGAGIHSARLAKRFNKVIVTDISQENIEFAKSQLQGPSYEFHVTKLEDTKSFPQASVDLVFAAAMLHFTDIDFALQAIAHQLKSGGTFAALCIGACRLEDPAVQEAWIKVFNVGCRQLIDRAGNTIANRIRRNACACDSGALPEAFFEPGALRIKLNETILDLPGGHYYLTLIPPELREKYPLVSQIGNAEQVIRESDDDWGFRKDISGLKDVLSTFPFDYETAEMKSGMNELETAVGEREIGGYWLVSTILATRK